MKKRKRRVYRIKRSGYKGRVSAQKKKSAIEVKVFTGVLTDKSVRTYKYGSPTFDLVGEFNFAQDVISGITIGTAQNQRIGSHIFVKKIVWDIWYDLCPKNILAPTTNMVENTAGLRIILHDARTTPIGGFFRTSTTYPFMGMIDRRSFDVHADKTYFHETGYPANITSSATLIGAGKTGKYRMISNVNRSVTFDPTTVTMKNDRDVYSLSIIGYMPNIAAATMYQTHCVNVNYRIYYTDD